MITINKLTPTMLNNIKNLVVGSFTTYILPVYCTHIYKNKVIADDWR